MRGSSPSKFLPIVFSLVIPSVCLFGSAGCLNWREAWVLLALNLTASIASSVLLARNPELREERKNFRAGKSWDKPIVAIVVLVGPVGTWITAGLDTRFHWSDGWPFFAFLAGVVVAALSAVWSRGRCIRIRSFRRWSGFRRIEGMLWL